MAATVADRRPTATAPTAVEVVSFVRGYHEYKDIWCPHVREILDLKREPTNPKDALAVCIQKDGRVTGHMPRNLAPLVSYFLERSQCWFGGDHWSASESWCRDGDGTTVHISISRPQNVCQRTKRHDSKRLGHC